MDSVFVFINGEQRGPYSRDRLQELLAENAIKSDTLAWQDGMAEWVPLAAMTFGTSLPFAENTLSTQSSEGLRPVPQPSEFASEVRELSAGQRLFNRYNLMRMIGRGGMGLVWLANDETLGEEIALKFLPETVRLDPIALEELKRETRRSRKLSHPNIVKVFDFVSDGNAAAISMEFIDGETLSGLRARQTHLCFEVGEIEPWTRQLIRAFSYAHEEARVVHRDLKPANIMVDRQGRAKVTDFGIASSIAENVSRVTVQRGSSGTLAYMSPQQAMGRAPSPQDDIYALGATLFELLTSKPPFYRGDILAQVSNVMPPTLAERRTEIDVTGVPIPEAWEETIAACLEKKPENRPQSMAEVGMRFGVESAIVPRAPMQPPLISSNTAPEASPAQTVPVSVVTKSDSLALPGRARKSRRILIGTVFAIAVLATATASYFLIAHIMTRAELEKEATIKVPTDDAQAAALRVDAIKGDMAAARELGTRYLYGNGVPREQQEGLKWLQIAAEKGDVKAQNLLGEAYETGTGVTQNFQNSFIWLQKSALQGNAEGEKHFGEFYGNGTLFPQDYNQAFDWFSKSSAQDYPDGEVALGRMYAGGVGVPQDTEKALTLFEKAVDQGDSDGYVNMGQMYLFGSGVPKDYAKALNYLTKADQSENRGGAFYIGQMYENGWGVTKDTDKAVEWYKKAGEQNADVKAALKRLGETTSQPNAELQKEAAVKVATDDAEAAALRVKAIMGDTKAALDLSNRYHMGVGVPKDEAEGLKWLEKAAEEGDVKAQSGLGCTYRNGWNGVQDFKKAIAWLQKAADRGDADAETNLGEMYVSGQGIQLDYQQGLSLLKKASDQGLAQAQGDIGGMYLNGVGVPQDYDQALAWYEKALKTGGANYGQPLGDMYLKGEGVTKDYGKAFTYLSEAAQTGSPDAEDDLGQMYENGWGVGKDANQAAMRYQKVADLGHADGEYRLGLLYESGSGVPFDPVKAMNLLKKAADTVPAADYQIGEIYSRGLGVPRDENQKNNWWQKAANMGDAMSETLIAGEYQDGAGGLPKDLSKSVEFYQKAATQGYAGAQYLLGQTYALGIGVDKDYSQALYWFQKAAAQGSSQGEYDMGDLYIHGWGVVRDAAQALAWFTKAADQQGGNENAENAIGQMYLQGEGVTKDYSQALAWFKKATSRDYSDNASVTSSYEIGTMYENGWGVAKDLPTAIAWYQKAGSTPDAVAALKRLGVSSSK